MNFFVFFMLIVPAVYATGTNLISVVLVYRHGDRTPTEFSPSDIYKDKKYWPTEPGELTNRGKQQHYALGRWLRDRYRDFLPDTYHKKDIYVRSTSTDRCLMSAAANLAGLYPPTSDQMWSSSIPWMPIPIHSVRVERDGLLKMGKACPNFQPKFKELLHNENFTAIDKENEALYKYLSENLGEEIKTFTDIEKVFDTMSIEAEYNMKLPNWTNKVLRGGMKVFPDEMRKWADLSYEVPTYTTELARLGTGLFFNTLASQFEGAAKNNSKKKLADKLVMFSAHKSTVCDLTHTLGVFKLTPYAGALIFELRKNPNTGKNYVSTLFKSGNDVEHLQINGCEVDCDFDKFLQTLAPYRMTEDQWEEECFSGATSNVLTHSAGILIIFATILYNTLWTINFN